MKKPMREEKSMVEEIMRDKGRVNDNEWGVDEEDVDKGSDLWRFPSEFGDLFTDLLLPNAFEGNDG
jgi:hypothetical protein